MKYETIRYDRTTFYEEVWKEPVRTVAQRYRISDVALAKTCRRLEIPLPPQGYWLRPERRRGERPSLPSPKPGIRVAWEVRVLVQKDDAPVPPELAEKLARERAPDAAIVVPNELVSPHRLVAISGKGLRKAQPYEGLVSCVSSDNCLDIRVAPSSIGRALLIMNTLVRALEARGLMVSVETENRSGYARRSNTIVVVDEEKMSFRLWEKYSLRAVETPPHLSKKERESWTLLRARNERIPNGRFALEVRDEGGYAPHRTWSDTDKRKIEGSLNEFVRELYVAAAKMKERRVNQEKARLEQEAAATRAREAESRRRAEEKRLDEFKQELDRWRFARDARLFLDEIRMMLRDRGLRVTKGGHIEEWLAWIAERADLADPLAKLRRDADEMAAAHGTRRPVFRPLGARLARARQRRRGR